MNRHETFSQFRLAVSDAINPKQSNFVLSQFKSLLSQSKSLLTQCKFVLSYFGGKKTFTGKTNLAAKARQTQGTFR